MSIGRLLGALALGAAALADAGETRAPATVLRAGRVLTGRSVLENGMVVVAEGKIAAGKLAQAVAYGARILQIEGNFDDCLELARKSAATTDEIELVNSVNPVRIEGQKTAAFEVCDVLGRAPDVHFLPVGNAGNITAYWKGYREYHADGVIDSLPRMFGFQAAGAAPLVLGHPVADPDTIATAIPNRSSDSPSAASSLAIRSQPAAPLRNTLAVPASSEPSTVSSRWLPTTACAPSTATEKPNSSFAAPSPVS